MSRSQHLDFLRRLPSKLPDPAAVPEPEYLLLSDLINQLERMGKGKGSLIEFHQRMRLYIRKTPVIPFSFRTSPRSVPETWLRKDGQCEVNAEPLAQ